MRSADVAQLILRLSLAIVIWPHGAQKALGLFGGGGIGATVARMNAGAGIPAALVYAVIAVEFLGPIALVLGVLTRLAALGLAIDMAVAAILVHAKNGFFMNFARNQRGERIEFFIAVGIGLALATGGPGRFALMKRS